MMFVEYKRRMQAKSAALLLSIETRLDRLMMAWLLVAGLASALRIATSQLQAPLNAAGLFPYLLLIVAPFASMVLALRWFADGDRLPRPKLRLARAGQWRPVSASAARAHPLYGAGGLMVSLLVGMLINVPVRAAEYLAAMPALSGQVPAWLSTLHMVMTLDVVLLSSLYTIAFVAALRRVPMFPRLLAAIWMIDLVMQLSIAKVTVAVGGLPVDVAAALQGLLEGNVKKVLISIALWLPYLLLSTRVNVTYRSRIPA
ncbi:MAG: DUF2569 domain-containing protein [Alphaproteobacteria bacterium]|nr:DUF2569 domain-containing protein [Alphaproteobacteria bacterium]